MGFCRLNSGHRALLQVLYSLNCVSCVVLHHIWARCSAVSFKLGGGLLGFLSFLTGQGSFYFRNSSHSECITLIFLLCLLLHQQLWGLMGGCRDGKNLVGNLKSQLSYQREHGELTAASVPPERPCELNTHLSQGRSRSEKVLMFVQLTK